MVGDYCFGQNIWFLQIYNFRKVYYNNYKMCILLRTVLKLSKEMHLNFVLLFYDFRESWQQGKKLLWKDFQKHLEKELLNSKMNWYLYVNFSTQILYNYLVVAFMKKKGFWFTNICQTKAWISIYLVRICWSLYLYMIFIGQIHNIVFIIM